MTDFNDKLGGLLAAVRDRGEFVGELGETFLFLPPAGAITPKQVLLIGLGEEKDLSLDTLKVVGRVAVREAVRLRAAHVSFAPTIRDQGNNTIDVGRWRPGRGRERHQRLRHRKTPPGPKAGRSVQHRRLDHRGGPAFFVEGRRESRPGNHDGLLRSLAARALPALRAHPQMTTLRPGQLPRGLVMVGRR